MYNSYQPSFGQQQGFGQQVQSQYRGMQKTFQPTGNVQSFYQPQQQMTSNYHTSNYVGNRQDHDAYLREDSMGPSTYAMNRGQTMSTLNNVHGTYQVNVPTSQMTQGYQGGVQGGVQGGLQGVNSYHTANYVGNRPDHDAYLREDSLRASTYAMGQSQGINTLNSVRGQYNVNTPTSQFTQGQFRSF